MNSGGNLRSGAAALVRYLKTPKPSPSPSSVGAKLVLERFISSRTLNLTSRLSLAAATGIIDSLCRLHPGRAHNVLHLSLSPHAEERYSDRTWDLIWEIYARELGLQEHFAIRVRHGDGHTGHRERHGPDESLVHEHGVLPLIHPITCRRMDMTDLYQMLEIADAYVEGRFGKLRERSRPIVLKPEQQVRLLEMRELGALHRAMDARGEPVTLPAPPDHEQQRRASRRRRYLRDKGLASQIRKLVGDPSPLPRTWEHFRRSLAERGLMYRVGIFRPGTPPRYSGRIHMKDDRGSRQGVAAATVLASLGLGPLEKILGRYEAPSSTKHGTLPRKLAARLPALQGIETLPHAIELLSAAGFSYELRLHRTKLGKEAVVGYVRDERNGKLRRAAGSWALSSLRHQFGSDVITNLTELPKRVERGIGCETPAGHTSLARARPLEQAGGTAEARRGAIATSPGSQGTEVAIPTGSASSSASATLRRSAKAPTASLSPASHEPASPKPDPEFTPSVAEGEELPEPETSTGSRSPSYSI